MSKLKAKNGVQQETKYPELTPLWIGMFCDILGFYIIIPFLPTFIEVFNTTPLVKAGKFPNLPSSILIAPAPNMVGNALVSCHLSLLCGCILKESLMKECKSYGIAERVIFAGLIHSSQISSYINIMDVLVHVDVEQSVPK